MSNITKRDLVVELSDRTGQTQAEVLEVFQAALELIAEKLSAGDDVTLRRFGTFELRMAKAKVGRNPNKPGTEMHIPARTVVKFKPGKELKDQVSAAVPKLARPS